MILKKILFVVVLIFLTPTIQAQPGSESPPPLKTPQNECLSEVGPGIKISNWFFGRRLKGPRGEFTYMPTRQIPYQADNDYGWKATISVANPPAKWHYIFATPAPVPNWEKYVGDDPGTTLAPDKKSVKVENVITATYVNLEEFWYTILDPVDPKGLHSMTVFINDVMACQFDFWIQ